MTISWGWKIAAGYTGFAAMIVCLVVASNHQRIDLVSPDYYKDEISYQSVLDASKNQAGLAGTLTVSANASNVVIAFPEEFASKALTGKVQLFSVVNKDWDKNYTITPTDNKFMISRNDLKQTMYTIKVSYKVDGKDFYFEMPLNLHA